uniref:Uncharacterized protein n=1 Tax=Timema shepardi TaxID=629360 RepID=A0A7R9AQL1_TIMSH|nr:unnamed protein product [Timema shepardi]
MEVGEGAQLIGTISFKSEALKVPFPQAPILTSWWTWIACNYYCENFQVVKKIIDSFDSNEATSIKVAQEPLSDPEIAVDCSSLSGAELLPEVTPSQFPRCCCFQRGIRLDGRVGEVDIGNYGAPDFREDTP